MKPTRPLDAWLAQHVSRRTLLSGGLTLFGLSAVRVYAGPLSPAWQRSPFTLGVASGDPTPDGVVLWTRLAPDPLNGGGMAPSPAEVRWEIARDDRFSAIARSGRITARPEGTPSTSRSTASIRTGTTGTAFRPATP